MEVAQSEPMRWVYRQNSGWSNRRKIEIIYDVHRVHFEAANLGKQLN